MRVEGSVEQPLTDNTHTLVTTKITVDVERSRGKPPQIAKYFYTLATWVKHYITVSLIIFGKYYPLLKYFEKIRNTLVITKRRKEV